jgi:hypothetical protein
VSILQAGFFLALELRPSERDVGRFLRGRPVVVLNTQILRVGLIISFLRVSLFTYRKFFLDGVINEDLTNLSVG